MNEAALRPDFLTDDELAEIQGTDELLLSDPQMRQSVTYRRLTGTSYDPETGQENATEVSDTINVLGGQVNAREVGRAGDLFEVGDHKFLIRQAQLSNPPPTKGDEIDLGDRTVEFHEATFLDAPVSVWMTERETETLFPVDWMGFLHLDEEALAFVDELDGAFDPSRLVEFHGRVLFWYQYVDVAKTNAEIDNLIETFDPEILAPAHGLVIREDATDYMAMMKDVTRTIDEQGRIGTLG